MNLLGRSFTNRHCILIRLCFCMLTFRVHVTDLRLSEFNLGIEDVDQDRIVNPDD